MNKNILLITLIILASCSKNDKIHISGKIENVARGSKIFLYEQQVSKSILLDSSKISSNGEFKFKMTSPDPKFFLLQLPNSGLINLLLSPGEKVRITADAANISSSLVISGSRGSEQILQLIRRHDSVIVHIDSLRAQYRRIKDPSISKEEVSALEKDFSDTRQAERKNTIRFIVENFNSMASILALYQKYDSGDYVLQLPRDLQYYKIVTDSLSKRYPGSKQVKALKFDFEKMMNMHKSEVVQNLLKNVSSTFPEIALPDAKGDTIKMSSYIGKIIILYFWSYESKISLMLNRDFMNLYKKYGKSGLVIYQVSIDTDKSKWLDAIKDIPWISVAEIGQTRSYYAGIYNITSLPASFLIDQKGNILGKNFSANELDKRIADLLKR